jgi:ferrochelatase
LRVSTRTLERTAGVIWLAVGVMLAVRGARMLEDASALGRVLALALGLAIGVLKGRYVLSRTARRNRRRIRRLAAPRAWNVFTWRFLVLIALMIALGKGMRELAEAGVWHWAPVAAVYLGIGAGLAVSALFYFRADPPPLRTRAEAGPAQGARPRGVVLVNLGTPEAATPGAVRRYLREFLSDPLVVEAPRWLWAFVLNVIVLPRRSGRVARAYASIWMDEGSPLLVHGRRLAQALRPLLDEGDELRLAMRYGAPSLPAVLDELEALACEELLVVPLFPQASRTTTGTIQAAAAAHLATRRAAPALAVLPPMYLDPGYISALAELACEAHGGAPPDFHVFSFHGLPEAYVAAGDPYLEHCRATSLALAAALGLARDAWEMVFQSRFGDEPWLQPYADEFVPALAARHARVQVTLPAFAADCLETLEEIGVGLRRDFRAAGGAELIVTPALNDHPTWVAALAARIRAHGRAGARRGDGPDELSAGPGRPPRAQWLRG